MRWLLSKHPALPHVEVERSTCALKERSKCHVKLFYQSRGWGRTEETILSYKFEGNRIRRLEDLFGTDNCSYPILFLYHCGRSQKLRTQDVGVEG